MKSEYDFSGGRKNPYVKHLRKPITIRLETATIDYFKAMALQTGMSYQNLINLYLRDCAKSGKKPTLRWQ